MNLNSITTPILFFCLAMVFTSYEGDKKINNPKYLNPLLSIDKRVDDLMQRMTLEDKVSQMNQFVGLEHMRSGNPNDDKANNDAQGFYKDLSINDVTNLTIEGKIGSFLHVLTAK